MNIKYLTIFLAFFVLLLSVGAISAADDSNDTIGINENSNQDIVKVQQNVKEIKTVENKNIISESDNSTDSTTKNTTSVKKTSVTIPNSDFIFKRDSKFKITVKDKTTKKAVKNLKLTLKIKDGKTYKYYTLKTDKKGVAQFSTKKLSLGSHAYSITSQNENYTVKIKDSLFVGNLYYSTLQMDKSKKLKNGDILSTFQQKKNALNKKGVYVDSWYSGGNNPTKSSPEPKYTKILNAKFYFKNTKTGKIITFKTKGELTLIGGIYVHAMPRADLIKGYTPIKTKIGYLTSK